MLWSGLAEVACQSGEENTRGRLKLLGRVGPLRAPVTVEAAKADRTALSFSLYLRDTQNSHTNAHSLEGLKVNWETFSHTNTNKSPGA